MATGAVDKGKSGIIGEMKEKNDSFAEKWDLKKFINRLDLNKWIILLAPLVLAILLFSKSFREIFTPFLLGIVFAYILSPLVNLLNKKIKLPRLLAIIFIFAAFVFLVLFLLNRTFILANQEIRQLSEESQDINKLVNNSARNFPWMTQDIFHYLSDSLKGLPKMISGQTVPIIKSTFGTIISLFAFFATFFYFLKDTEKINRFLYRSKLYNQIHQTINSYFRGQIILIIFMTTVTWIFLRIMDVKFAFLLSVFTGFAEIVPYIGPILAGSLAVLVTLLTDSSAFGYTPVAMAIIVALGYFFLRQFEDFIVIPQVVGRSVQLHPLVILFTVLLAGKLYGVLGLLFGVPFVATYKVMIEHMTEEKK